MKMTHALWLMDTAVLARPRSAELDQVDSAPLVHEKALQGSSGLVREERQALQQARRNKLQAVENLDTDLVRDVSNKINSIGK